LWRRNQEMRKRSGAPETEEDLAALTLAEIDRLRA